MLILPFLAFIFPYGEIEQWVGANFANVVAPPFSFIYDGKPSSLFISNWEFKKEKKESNSQKTNWLITYRDPQTKLRIRCELTVFKDFPAVEWVLKFKNEGKAETPIVENIQALDLLIKSREETVLHYALGSNAQRDDFAPQGKILEPDKPIELVPIGGRSSNTTALPFFNIRLGEERLIIGIGWSGQWKFKLEKKNESISVKAGMELTHLKLLPGEEIRTPRILLMFLKGKDIVDSQNLLRRFLIVHHIPKINGKPLTLPFSCSSSGPPDEANRASVSNQLEFVKFFLETYKIEYLWIDAGWFEGGWPNGVGNWFPRKDGFPEGFHPLTDALKKAGAKGLILWFEPERVFQGTWIDREHPDWVIRLPGNPNGLLNLGNKEALAWLTNHISEMIDKDGISVYRQDFNMDPLPYWRSADAPDRQGISEIRHIEGLYKFCDDLLKLHPNLIIDNCASGGRRIDLETISRSVMLWRTDYQYFEPNGQQSHTYGISFYLPTTATSCGYPNAYLFRSAMGNGMGIWVPWNPSAPYEIYRQFLPPLADWDPHKPFPIELAKGLVEEFRLARDFFYGDYYPLSPYSTSDDDWIAYQFHREDLKGGIVFVFRRQNCQQSDFSLRLRGLKPDAVYEVQLSDDNLNKIKRRLRGKKLMEGTIFSIEKAPGSLFVYYKERDATH
ncbi:alpha-galactosidase [bacterium]|nr:alpha-galactosidase [bacterium]